MSSYRCVQFHQISHLASPLSLFIYWLTPQYVTGLQPGIKSTLSALEVQSLNRQEHQEGSPNPTPFLSLFVTSLSDMKVWLIIYNIFSCLFNHSVYIPGDETGNHSIISALENSMDRRAVATVHGVSNSPDTTK